MATVYGIQLTNRLNTATVRRPLRLRRYDSYITTFTTPNGISQLYRALDFQPTQFTASILQTFPPLNAWNPTPQFIPSDLDLSQWKEWITDRMRSLATVLQRAYPLVANARREVNPIVIGLITSAFLNQRPVDRFLPLLFLEPGQRDPIAPLVTVDVTLSDDTYVSGNVLYTPAGLKYLTLRAYDPTRPSSICTFGKHVPFYAIAAFYPHERARLSILHRYNGGPPLLEHFDQPTYGPHVLIPALGSPEGYDAVTPTFADLLLTEGLLDAFRLNASAGPSTAVARIDQTYHVVMNGNPGDYSQLASRLTNLSLLAVQGCQMTVQVSDHPSMNEVCGFLVRLLGPGDPQRLINYQTDQIQIWRGSPFPFGNNPRYIRRRGRNPFTVGTTTYVPDTKTPLPFLPQYRQATVNKNNARASYQANALPGLPIYHGFALTGGAFFQSRDITGDPANVWPVNTLPDLPQDYFSIPARQRRELLSRLRSPSDRSLVKDTHNISFASTVLNPVNNQIILTEGFSMAYLGAASTHGSSDQPLIIDALKTGAVPGVPVPSKITQFGYDVANGSIMDATLAPPTGTFSFVYSDVDQVEDAGLSIVAANRVAAAVTHVALSMTTAGGLTVVKVNFPTPAFWTQLFRQHATHARALYILKPLIVNSVEVFLLFVSRTSDGNLVSSPSLRQFLVQLFDRSAQLSELMAHVPLLGDVDDGTTSLGFNACRLYGPDLPAVNVTPEVQTLAYQLATIVPSTSFIAREDYDGATAVTFYGKRTFLSRRRLDRLVSVPVPATNAINHQTRFTGSPTYQLFPINPAPVTQLLAGAYNRMISAQLTHVGPQSLVDCGTGPECRVLSLVPPRTAITMIDARPPAELLAAFDPAMNQYIVGDFLDPALWLVNPYDALTAIFSLGAAFAGAGVDLVAGLTAFLRLVQPGNLQHLWLQLNTPLTSNASLPGLLDIDTRTNQYVFNGGQRTEPYAPPADILAAVRQVFPAATTSWLTASPTMDWAEYVIGLGSSMSLDDVTTMITYSGLAPILHIDLTQRPMDVPVPLVVGVQANVHVAAPSQQTTVVGSIAGVQVFTADGVTAPSTLGPLAAVWDPALLRWDLTLTPNQAGVLDVVVDSAGVLLNRGSTTIALPPAAIAVNFPPAANRDYTNAGNDARVACDPFYRLGVFVSVNGTFQPVNPERAAIVAVPNARVLHYVYDLSDNHVLMYICDITDNSVGRNIALPLADIFQTVFPNNTPLLASPPYPTASGRLLLNGQVFIDLDPLPPVLPPGVQIQALSTAIEPARPTVEVPAGTYVYVVV
ncbi:putative guanylyl/methyl transferase [Etheostoma fonticola aquareovirus]|uniref:putative guanylyl/methyl transferase n=1 Tax=Etheostoma fonticola aquareovirus TaxID=1862978 RepID=UPI0007F13819|nr:putative guanylyl/methyl transferase [Etheostoma fonticola aquareovirus]ANN11946.1 putative guanylyl/methyl transferase [Etheostoma fonticola aquareovirus]